MKIAYLQCTVPLPYKLPCPSSTPYPQSNLSNVLPTYFSQPLHYMILQVMDFHQVQRCAIPPPQPFQPATVGSEPNPQRQRSAKIAADIDRRADMLPPYPAQAPFIAAVEPVRDLQPRNRRQDLSRKPLDGLVRAERPRKDLESSPLSANVRDARKRMAG